MTIEKQTVPYCLNVVWDETGKLKGAAYYEQDVLRDDGAIISVKQGDAQPVAILGQKGIDISGIVGMVGRDAIALAEAKAAELDAALADVQQLTNERDTLKAQLEQLQATAAQPVARVPTAALLIVLRKRGLREQFDSVCTSLPPEQQEYVKEMLQMPYTRRDHPLVAMVQQAFGWTDAEVDALFAEADAV